MERRREGIKVTVLTHQGARDVPTPEMQEFNDHDSLRLSAGTYRKGKSWNPSKCWSRGKSG